MGKQFEFFFFSSFLVKYNIIIICTLTYLETRTILYPYTRLYIMWSRVITDDVSFTVIITSYTDSRANLSPNFLTGSIYNNTNKCV